MQRSTEASQTSATQRRLGFLGPLRVARSRRFAILAAPLLAFFILYPMLALGYLGDDLGASWQHGFLAHQHIGVWSQIGAMTYWWIHNEGRFYPVSAAYSELFFSWNPPMVVEKAVQLFFVLLNIATVFLAMRRAGGERLALAASLGFVATLQVRAWNDPVIMYFIIVPVTLEALLLCLWFWLIALENRSYGWAGAATVAGLCAMLTYELSYPLVAAVAVFCWRGAQSRRWRTILLSGTLVPLGLLIALDLALRSHVHVTMYALTLDANAYVRTFFDQLVAAIPLSYSIFKSDAHPLQSLLRPGAAVDGAAILAAVFAFVALGPGIAVSRRATLRIAAFGLALWVFPAAIISFGHGLQISGSISYGYLNVYIESVGVALLTASLLLVLMDKTAATVNVARAFRIGVALLFGLTIEITAATNRESMAVYIPVWTQTRTLLDGAFAGGLMSALIDRRKYRDSQLYLNGIYPISPIGLPYLIFQDSGRYFGGAVFDQYDYIGYCAKQSPSSICRPATPTWLFQVDPNLTRVALTHVDSIRHLPDGTIAPIADRWFVSGMSNWAKHPSGVAAPAIGRTGIVEIENCAGEPVTNVMSGDVSSNVAFLAGFYPPETRGDDRWLWSRADSSLRITKLIHQKARAELTMSLTSLRATRVKIEAPGTMIHVIATRGHKTWITIPIEMRTSDAATVRFHSTGNTFHVPNDDRELAIRVADVEFRAPCR